MVLINPQIDGIARHVLTFLAGFLVSGGYITLESIPGIVTGLVTLATVVWSVLSKTKPTPAPVA